MPENDLLPGVIPMQVEKYFIRCVRNTDVSGLSINNTICKLQVYTTFGCPTLLILRMVCITRLHH